MSIDIDIEKYKKIIFNILCDIDSICRNNGIKYTLYAGTLIGAIRHNGFIPWDDDIDIIMDRENYDKFLSVKNELSDKYNFVCPMDDNKLMFPRAMKVFDKTSCIKEIDVPYFEGPFVDIFFTMGLKYKSIKRNLMYTRKYRYFCRMYEIKRGRIQVDKASRFMNKIAFINSKFYSEDKLKKIILKYQNYNNNLDVCTTSFGGNYVLKKNYFKDLIEHDFESKKFFISKDYDEFLKKLYGDYMTLPPEENRVCKHLEFLDINVGYEEYEKNEKSFIK